MALAETTNPYAVNPFASTADASPAEIRRQAEAVWQRISKAPKRPVYYEPQWEDPGVHGSGRQVALRSARLSSSKVGRGRLALPTRESSALPPLPSRGMPAGKVLLIASVAAVAAGGLVWYLWKHKPAAPAAHVGEDLCGLDMLGAE